MEQSWITKNWLLLNNKSICFIKNKIAGLLTPAILFFTINMFSQTNLIPNGSFENYYTCPNGNNIDNIINFFQPNTAGNSSDAFNSCNNSTNPYLAVPYNVTYQYPRSGNGYAGIAMFFDTAYYNIDNWREYIEVGLTDSLKNGKKYCVRFYTNKSNISSYAVKNIQAVLTNNNLLYNDPNYGFIQGVTPIMEADSVITDTLNWIPIQTIYTAHGGERFLTIGNFSSGANTIYKYVWPFNGSPNSLGYYLIDDVSIYEQPEIDAGNDTLIPPGDSIQLGIAGRPDVFYSWQPSTGLNNANSANPMATPAASTTYILTVTDTNQLACASVFKDTVTVLVGYVGINEYAQTIKCSVFPNPFSETIVFKVGSEAKYEIKISDVAGKQITNIIFIGKEYSYKNIELTQGMYLYEIKNERGNSARGKLLKR